MNRGTILIVDDSEDDIFFIRRALTRAGISNPIQVIDCGDEALAYLKGLNRYADRIQYPLPCLTFMDIKMPGKSGLEVLAEIRNDPQLKKLVVIMLTTSGHSRDIAHAATLGANSYLVKPSDTDNLNDVFKKAADYWLQVHQHTDLLETSAFHAGM
ncbi:response regulator [Pedosphaera parvula]|uniref:Response regulator receiver protein n=1 Tax=Pedosphaera parvula (strain Ellin514) TaxID=320771 RepID=B9XFA5_PEDPL|nr:response regulator [Pedosphaera parvula]EEF61603.1 response regulator receiver protein [Pedosphaera parvula Ellin514]